MWRNVEDVDDPLRYTDRTLAVVTSISRDVTVSDDTATVAASCHVVPFRDDWIAKVPGAVV